MTIELPDALQEWIEHQAEAGGYATAGAFVEAVLRQAQRRWRQTIDEKLLEALNSGAPTEVTPEFWADQRRQLEAYVRDQDKAAG